MVAHYLQDPFLGTVSSAHRAGNTDVERSDSFSDWGPCRTELFVDQHSESLLTETFLASCHCPLNIVPFACTEDSADFRKGVVQLQQQDQGLSIVWQGTEASASPLAVNVGRGPWQTATSGSSELLKSSQHFDRWLRIELHVLISGLRLRPAGRLWQQCTRTVDCSYDCERLSWIDTGGTQTIDSCCSGLI